MSAWGQFEILLHWDFIFIFKSFFIEVHHSTLARVPQRHCVRLDEKGLCKSCGQPTTSSLSASQATKKPSLQKEAAAAAARKARRRL